MFLNKLTQNQVPAFIRHAEHMLTYEILLPLSYFELFKLVLNNVDAVFDWHKLMDYSLSARQGS